MIPNEFLEIANQLRQLGDANEMPTRDDAIRAIAILNQMRLDRPGDYLLYAASVNLLNRYVKIDKHSLNYRFKNYLYPFLNTIMIEKPPLIRIYTMNDANLHNLPLILVDIMGIHCSFHQLRHDIIEYFAHKHQYKFISFDWDKIRKQQCAVTFFNLSMENHKHLSRQTCNQKDLFESIQLSIIKYKTKPSLKDCIPFIKYESVLSMNMECLTMNTAESANQKVIFVSMIGDSDPIRSQYDGPMLHIARHYHPTVIHLLLTQRMQKEDKKILLEEAINRLYESNQWEKPEIRFHAISNPNPARFENFGFTDFMLSITKDYSLDQVLVNISSGTPQMIASMCLEIVTNNLNVKALQVDSPDPNDVSIDHAINRIDQLNQNKDEDKKAKNRTVVTDLLEFNRARNKQRIQTFINQFEYNTALKFMEENHLTHNRAYKLITDVSKTESMRLLDEKMLKNHKESDFQYLIVNYFLQWELEFKRNKYINYILKSTSLIVAMCKYHMKEKFYTQQTHQFWDLLEKDGKITRETAGLMHPIFRQIFNNEHYKNNATTQYLLTLYKLISIEDDFYKQVSILRQIESSTRNYLAHEINLSKISEQKYKNDATIMHDSMLNVMKIVFHDRFKDINLMFFEQSNQDILDEVNQL